MKDTKLQKAIEELPVLEAPDVWTTVVKELSSDSDRKLFFLAIFLILSFGIALFLVNLTSGTDQKYHVAGIERPVIDNEITDAVSENSDEISPVYTDNDNDVYEDDEETKISTENRLVIPKNVEKEVKTIENTYNFNNSGIFAFKSILLIEEKGDNLVNNPSFEEYTVCPKGIVGKPEKKLIPYWDVPSKGTPDYFNSCCKGEAGVPQNFAGKIRARTGNAYCGIILRQNFTRDNKITGEKPLIYREYIQTELKTELVKGKKYRIRFYVCNSSNSRFAVDAIGACITTEKVKINTKEVMNMIPIVENPSGQFMTNQSQWIAIEGIYQAQGGEKYLTIGNFYNNYSTNYIMQNGDSKFNYAYYYIDDVSVFEVEELYETRNIIDSLEKTDNYCNNSEF
ncbi:MAG TPA: hypothetical protein PLL66_07135 [Bacteroidales bacterium]|nr:hypothetical protein [Bacteroidales bacterium]